MPDLAAALAEDATAVDHFTTATGAVPHDRWATAGAAGTWSPGQIAEHVAISYEVARAVLLGNAAIKPMPRLLRPVLRALFLPRVLRTGRFPPSRTSPAFQPSATAPDREGVLERIRTRAREFGGECERLAAAGTAHFDHPVFGRLSLHDYVRFTALHTRHHERQLGHSGG